MLRDLNLFVQCIGLARQGQDLILGVGMYEAAISNRRYESLELPALWQSFPSFVAGATDGVRSPVRRLNSEADPLRGRGHR